HLIGLVHLGDPVVAVGLARRRDARHHADDRGLAGVGVRAGIGALADRQGAVRRGPRRGGAAPGPASRERSAADHEASVAAAGEPDGALRQPAAVLADRYHLGRFVDRSLWLLSLGADDRRAGARCAGRPGGEIFRLRGGRRCYRQNSRFAYRADYGAPRAPRHLCVLGGDLPRRCRLLSQRGGRRVPADGDADRGFRLFLRGRVLQPCPVHGRAIRCPPRSPLRRVGAGGKWRRQDPGPAGSGADRRKQQSRVAAGHGECRPACLPVPQRQHAAGGAGVRLPRCRDAWQANGARRRDGDGSADRSQDSAEGVVIKAHEMSPNIAAGGESFEVAYLVLSGTTTAARCPEILGGLVGLGFSTVIALPTPNASRVIALRDLADVKGVQVVESYFDLAIRPRPPRGVVLFAPCSFNSLNKLAHGIADNLALSVVAEAIGRGTPVIVGPSLNTPLLNHPEARASLATLPAWGVTIVPPVDEGEGPRLAPSAVLVDAVRPYVR